MPEAQPGVGHVLALAAVIDPGSRRPIETRVGTPVAATCYIDNSPPPSSARWPGIKAINGAGRPSKRFGASSNGCGGMEHDDGREDGELMQITIIGATGGVGAALLAASAAAGHTVTALVREPGKLRGNRDVTAITGDIVDPAAVTAAIRGSEAVLWAVGATRNAADQPPIFEAGARTLVEAMRAAGVRRVVALSGAGITIAGERKPIAGRLMTLIVRIAARHVYEAKRREYEVFSGSDLDWTLVRPPRVVEGLPTGRVVIGDRLASSPSPRVTWPKQCSG